MSPDAEIFAYCERGLDPAFFAEPINAFSNGAFILAGLAALSPPIRPTPAAGWLMPRVFAALVIGIGIGSFLFHTFATPWAAIADVAPIGVFMLGYFAFALRALLSLSGPATLLLTLAFAISLPITRFIRCDAEGLLLALDTGQRCLNGSMGYLPALFAVLTIGAVLWSRRHPARRAVLAAGGIFAVSLTLRTIDPTICLEASIAGQPVGTHFLWHLLNAAVLYLLVRTTWLAGHAPARHGRGRAQSHDFVVGRWCDGHGDAQQRSEAKRSWRAGCDGG